MLLEKYNEFEVIGEALDKKELFDLLTKMKPDVIVMDLMLPHKTVVSISKKLTREYPEIPFILITVSAIEYTLLECIINGAKGIIWRETSAEELVKAIKTVADGHTFFQIPDSVKELNTGNSAAKPEAPASAAETLSPRELEVLKYVANGLSHKQIAKKLFISHRTVESHKNKILLKLNLKNTSELMRYALRNRLIELN